MFLTELLLMLAIVPFASAEPTAGGTVVVRTFNYARANADEVADARMTVDLIFKKAGITVAWRDCRVPQTDHGAPCIEPLEVGRDLMLRLVDQAGTESVGGPRVSALGTSLLDRERRAGVLMTVDLHPIREIARPAPATGTLLGRAIAHEMGHMLLGTSHHARNGLMRALWKKDELRATRPADWEFSKPEAAQMRQGLALRSRAAN